MNVSSKPLLNFVEKLLQSVVNGLSILSCFSSNTVWKLRLGKSQDYDGWAEIYKLTSMSHHVSAVFGSS